MAGNDDKSKDMTREKFTQPAQPTVLVVEDETAIRHGLTEFLRGSGLRVLEAGSGAEAVSLLSGEVAVDIVCSHVRMPGEPDGFALARWVRANRPRVRTLLTSSHVEGMNASEPALKEPGNYAGILDHIQRLLAPGPTGG